MDEKKSLSRAIEHQQDSLKGKWENSGATEHILKISIGCTQKL